jgi:hypothetical protein
MQGCLHSLVDSLLIAAKRIVLRIVMRCFAFSRLPVIIVTKTWKSYYSNGDVTGVDCVPHGFPRPKTRCSKKRSLAVLLTKTLKNFFAVP